MDQLLDLALSCYKQELKGWISGPTVDALKLMDSVLHLSAVGSQTVCSATNALLMGNIPPKCTTKYLSLLVHTTAKATFKAPLNQSAKRQICKKQFHLITEGKEGCHTRHQGALARLGGMVTSMAR